MRRELAKIAYAVLVMEVSNKISMVPSLLHCDKQRVLRGPSESVIVGGY